MTTTTYHEPDPELRHRIIAAGEARVAVFTRTYQTTIEDLWDACTNPERLRRWYGPVTGDLLRPTRPGASLTSCSKFQDVSSAMTTGTT
jgi:uncharacterized protein YndB with AHSA1/START domain